MQKSARSTAVGSGRELAVEEDGDPEAADPGGDSRGGRAGGVAIPAVEPDDRADVEGADRRVHALVAAMSILSTAAAAPAGQRAHQRLGSPARVKTVRL